MVILRRDFFEGSGLIKPPERWSLYVHKRCWKPLKLRSLQTWSEVSSFNFRLNVCFSIGRWRAIFCQNFIMQGMKTWWRACHLSGFIFTIQNLLCDIKDTEGHTWDVYGKNQYLNTRTRIIAARKKVTLFLFNTSPGCVYAHFFMDTSWPLSAVSHFMVLQGNCYSPRRLHTN